MDGDREPAVGASAGDGKSQPKRVTITANTQADNMMGFFASLPPGTKAAAVTALHQDRRPDAIADDQQPNNADRANASSQNPRRNPTSKPAPPTHAGSLPPRQAPPRTARHHVVLWLRRFPGINRPTHTGWSVVGGTEDTESDKGARIAALWEDNNPHGKILGHHREVQSKLLDGTLSLGEIDLHVITYP